MTEQPRRRILGISELGRRIVIAFLIVALISVIVDSAISWATASAQFDRFVRRQEITTTQVTAAAARIVYEGHAGWNSAALLPLLDAARQIDAEIRITDVSGRPVASSPDFAVTPVRPSRTAPVTVAGQQVGSVTLRFDHSGLITTAGEYEAVRLRVRILGLATAALLAIIVSVVVSRRITSPIDRTVAAMRARTAGDRDFRIADVRATGELGELLQGFNEANDAIDRQERARRNLVADIAHELRTPVAVLQAGLEAMLDGISEPTPDGLGSLHDEVLRLGRSIEALRELAAAEAAALQLRLVPHDLADIARAATAALADQFAVAELGLTCDLASTMVFCDYDRMREVTTNLLTNAMKYTPAGGSVRLEVGPASPERARLRVSDSGIGIAASDLPHVTERFFRGRRSADMAAGSGLGLTIVDELVRAQHGDLDITSEPGAGTQATITLPRAPSALPRSLARPARR